MSDKAKQNLTGPRIEVVEVKTDKVIHVVKLHDNNRTHACKVDDGMQHNLDHSRFYTRIKGVRSKS